MRRQDSRRARSLTADASLRHKKTTAADSPVSFKARPTSKRKDGVKAKAKVERERYNVNDNAPVDITDIRKYRLHITRPGLRRVTTDWPYEDLGFVFRWDRGYLTSNTNIGPADRGNIIEKYARSPDAPILAVLNENKEVYWQHQGWQDIAKYIFLTNPENPLELRLPLELGDACLMFQPTSLAYVASTPGLRLILIDGKARTNRCATVGKLTDDGLVSVRIDNSSDEETIDPRPGNVQAATRHGRKSGDRIMILHDGRFVDATVVSWFGDAQGNRHTVKIDGENIDVDLNDMNHSLQRFKDASDFAKAKESFCHEVVEKSMYLEDGITGNRLHVENQVLSINAEAVTEKAEVDVGPTWRELYPSVLNADAKGGVSKKAVPFTAVMLDKAAQIDTVIDLAPLLLKPNLKRSEGACVANAFLFRAIAGSGKTWSVLQLLHSLAKILCSTTTVDCFVPLLIPIQKLARILRRLDGVNISTSNIVLIFIQSEYSGRQRMMLEQALDLRLIVVLLDGIDEASDISERIENAIIRKVVPLGMPLVATSRPEGVRLRLYKQDFVIYTLMPLTQAQQDRAIEQQMQGNVLFERLIKFKHIRMEHDRIYCTEAFPRDTDRQYLENFNVRDLFVLQDGSGKYDPQMRQAALDGGALSAHQGRPVSACLKRYDQILSEDALTRLDQILSTLASETEEDIRASVVALLLPDEGLELAVKLCLLVVKWKKKPLSGQPPASAVTLWPRVLSHTDRLLVVAERVLPVFQKALTTLVTSAGLDPAKALQLGSLKDPVRIHEKAQEEYARRFDDSALPEANVLDVLRARIICSDMTTMQKLSALIDGFELKVDGELARFDLIRTKNKFANPDGRRLRKILHNVRIRYKKVFTFIELEIHHKLILAHDDASGANDQYNFFRALLADAYADPLGESLDLVLEKRMEIFSKICKVPVLLSILSCGLKSSETFFPADIFELYDMGIRASFQTHFSETPIMKRASLTKIVGELMQRVAIANHFAERRVFTNRHVEDACKQNRNLFAVWQKLLEEGNIPLIKILDEAQGGEFQFKHLSFQEALFAQSLASGEVSSFWENDKTLKVNLEKAWNKNMCEIGRGHLGDVLANLRPCVVCDFNETGYGNFWNLLEGVARPITLIVENDKYLYRFQRTGGMTALAEFTQLSLDIGEGNEIGAKGASMLTKLTKLSNLSIGPGNNIRAEGAVALRGLKLANLSIGSDNDIGAEAFALFLEDLVTAGTHLVTFTYGGTEFTRKMQTVYFKPGTWASFYKGIGGDEGVKAFNKLALTSLTMGSDNELGASGAEVLKQLNLPSLAIESNNGIGAKAFSRFLHDLTTKSNFVQFTLGETEFRRNISRLDIKGGAWKQFYKDIGGLDGVKVLSTLKLSTLTIHTGNKIGIDIFRHFMAELMIDKSKFDKFTCDDVEFNRQMNRRDFQAGCERIVDSGSIALQDYSGPSKELQQVLKTIKKEASKDMDKVEQAKDLLKQELEEEWENKFKWYIK